MLLGIIYIVLVFAAFIGLMVFFEWDTHAVSLMVVGSIFWPIMLLVLGTGAFLVWYIHIRKKKPKGK